MLDEKAFQTELEQAIDSIGLRRLLDLVTNICHEKADHVRTNWQDESMARAWERDAKRIDTCASKVVSS